MEDTKGRDDDSSESSYSAISHVSKPSSQKQVLALKTRERGQDWGVHQRLHGEALGMGVAWASLGCTPLALSRPQRPPAQGQGWGVRNFSSGTFCTLCLA